MALFDDFLLIGHCRPKYSVEYYGNYEIWLEVTQGH